MSIQTQIAELIQKHEAICVRILADKYGFDPVEAAVSLPRCDPVAVAPLSKKAAADAKKATREAKKVAKADKPKRAKTGYLMFCDAERPSIKDETPDFKPQEVIRELGRRWKQELTEEDRKAWNDLAKDNFDGESEGKSPEAVVEIAAEEDRVFEEGSDLELEENDD